MQAPDQIADLFFKYLRNELTPEEEIRLQSWRQETLDNEAIFKKLTDPEQIRELLKDYDSRRNAWDKLVKLAPELKPAIPVRRIWWKPFSIAAAILALIVFTIFIRTTRLKSNSNSNNTDTEISKNNSADSIADLPAVRKKAILTLSNGKQILLDSSNRSDVRSLGNNIAEQNGGKLSYVNSNDINSNTETFNVLTTPRGGQFQLSLPDGSRVWLNAASTIKYPIAFVGKERKVEIEGEAYFEVEKNTKKPFIVVIGNNKIEVLGTHFNINSYKDEPKISVALLEGSIRFQTSKEIKVLTPGELALISNSPGNQNIELIKNADVESTISWKSGRILFKDADVQTIMRIVSRWYDLDVVYQGNIPKRSITGGISKEESLTELLKVLELNKIYFKIKGNQITITQ